MAKRIQKKVSKEKKEWREFEKIVARIEGLIGPIGATVKSPDKIRGLRGKPRDVDASIRFNSGTTPILLVIECRKRGRRQDITWIEQLVTKRNRLQISKIIAVSSQGLSEEAEELAKESGIESRTFAELNSDDIRSWLAVGVMQIFRTDWCIKSLEFVYRSLDEREPDFPVLPWDALVFSRGSQSMSAMDLMRELEGLGATEACQIPFDGECHRRTIVANYPNDSLRLSANNLIGIVPEIRFILDLKKIELSTTPVGRFGEYSASGQPLFQAAEWTMPLESNEVTFSFHRNASSGDVTSHVSLLDQSGNLHSIPTRTANTATDRSLFPNLTDLDHPNMLVGTGVIRLPNDSGN